MFKKIILVALVVMSFNILAAEDSICYMLKKSDEHAINYIKLTRNVGSAYYKVSLYSHSNEELVLGIGSVEKIQVQRNCSRNTDAGDDLCQSGPQFESATLYSGFDDQSILEEILLGSQSSIKFYNSDKYYPLFYNLCDFIGRNF